MSSSSSSSSSSADVLLQSAEIIQPIMAIEDNTISTPKVHKFQIDFMNTIKDNIVKGKTINIIHLPTEAHGTNLPKRNLFYLKKTFVFIPHIQFSAVPLPICKSCKTASMKPLGWAEPRYIHDVYSSAYLLHYRYQCKNKDCKATSCAMEMEIDQEILNYIPVLLTTKSGVTKEFMNIILANATTGISFDAIGKCFGTLRIFFTTCAI